MNQTTKFNMSAKTLERLDELLRKAAGYYAAGNLNRFFFALKNAKLQSMFKFNKSERKRLKEIEKKFYNQIDKKMKWGYSEVYNEYLLDCMNKYGLLLPDKIDDLHTAY